jgi:two-component system, OmpR family, sensor kinase
MNRHSVFTKINAFFAMFIILLVTLFAGVYIAYSFKAKGDTMRHVHQYMHSLRYNESVNLFNLELRVLDKQELTDITTRVPAREFGRPDDNRPRRERIYEDGGRHYIVALTQSGEIGLEDISSHSAFYISYWCALIIVLGGVTWLYRMIINSLRPLKTFEEEIRGFGQNIKKPESLNFEPKGEIESIRRAFYDSSNKIASLLSAREVFLKNTAHELKTPIAKGLVVAYMVDDEKQKSRLIEIFNRLNQIVESVRAVEEMSMDGFTPCMQKIPLKRLCIDTMRRALISDESVELYVDDCAVIDADERLFSIALSNLLENGVKFSDDAKVECALDEAGIHIKNRGAALDEPLGKYMEPFYKETSLRNSNGMGLGLYLTKKALEMQGMALMYEHKDGVNVFSIDAYCA